MTKKISLILFAVVAFMAFLVWLFVASSKPLPGQKMVDLGRKHVPMGEKVDYNSNPPTSGPHYEDWVRSGVYETPKDDGYLIHSLEHGYVIMSYNCDKKVTGFRLQGTVLDAVASSAYAHGVEEEATQSSEATSSGQLPDAFRGEDCHKLVDQLIFIHEKKGKTRLIVIPRPILDSKIALTAWNYIDKFNDFNEQRITKFIDAHLNQGPEKTMEQ